MGAEYYERPYEIVKSQIESMSGRANDALKTASDAITRLLDIPSPQTGSSAPNLTMPADPEDDSNRPTDPKIPAWVAIIPPATPAFNDALVSTALLDNLDGEEPIYDPPAVTLNIPATPAPINTSGAPLAPTLITIDIPAPPGVTEPELGDMVQVVIPLYPGLDLPVFDAKAPQFTATAPSTLLAWSEPTYQTESLTTLKARVAAMLAGGTGLPAVIEQALFDRARSRVDVLADRNLQEALDTWAGRNFDMPPGMLVAQADQVREDNNLATNSIVRDILAQAAQWEIENLRFAVTNGIALETQLIQLFTAQAERGFQAAKYRVEADIALYNAQATVFNALNAGYQAQATVYAERIKGALAQLEGYKSQIEAEKLKGDINESTVKIFQARIDAIGKSVELYKGRMAGVQALADYAKSQSENYRGQVQAWAEKMNAEKIRFDAFRTEMEGEQTKATILDISTRAFASKVQAFEGKINGRVAAVRAKVDSIGASTQRFVAEAGVERDRVTVQAEGLRQQIGQFEAETRKYAVDIESNDRGKALVVQKFEARLRNNIAAFDVYMKEYDASMQRLIQEMTVRVEALKTVATATSNLAAGVFSAMHVSAQLQGDARVSDDYSRQDIYRFDGSQ